VSIEGINGVGKTTTARSLAAGSNPRCTLLDELTDQVHDPLAGRVIAALSARNDPFLRVGHPVVETLALLALQVRRGELVSDDDFAGVDVLLEDRGADTLAVSQAVILHAQYPEISLKDTARRLLGAVQKWRRLPDATILLTGDPDTCLRRFTERSGHRLTPADRLMLERIDALYRQLAVEHPERYLVVDVTGMSRESSADAVHTVLIRCLQRRSAARAHIW